MKVGIIGCGYIADIYFQSQNLFNNINIIACADIINEAAEKSAKEQDVKVQSVEDLLTNKDIDLILNLTIPSSHKEIIQKTLESGKHSFSEKPLAMSFREGLELKKLSDEKGLQVGCAPDTFLGAAGQKARQFIDENKIGKVSLGTFNMMSHGMEHWHPNPDFFFKPGGGPIFDVGVYYITQLVNLLGPVENIISVSGTIEQERTITSEPRYGEKIKVETPTTLMAVLEFANKTKIQLFASWDVWKHQHNTIELYGSNGSLVLPDPNFFGGELLVSNKDSDWDIVKTDKMFLGIPNEEDGDDKVANYRGIGLSDMVNCISNNKNARCSIDLALHVLEIMDGILISSKNNSIYKTETSCDQPAPLTENDIKNLKH